MGVIAMQMDDEKKRMLKCILSAVSDFEATFVQSMQDREDMQIRLQVIVSGGRVKVVKLFRERNYDLDDADRI